MAGAIVGLGLTLLVAWVLVERRDRIPMTSAKPAAEYEQSAPNIVVVMTDDQAIDTMRAMPPAVPERLEGSA